MWDFKAETATKQLRNIILEFRGDKLRPEFI